MLENVRDFVKNTQWFQFLLVLLAGIAIGAIFYPTKRIEERERHRYEEETKVLKEEHSKELSKARDTLDKTSEQYRSQLTESERKITKLTTENSTLKSSQKTSYYKLVKPDGTIEVRKFSETQVDESKQVVTSIQEEFKEKIASIESKWEKVHKERVTSLQKEFDSKQEEYKHKIDELEKSKVVEINQKRFGIEVGLLTSRDYYGHATYDVFGPIFLGFHTQLGSSSAMGGGLGIRF